MLIGPGRNFCPSWPNQKEASVTGLHFIQEDSPHEIGTALAAFICSAGVVDYKSTRNIS
jgi:haloalkane dehalogenase